MIVNIYRSWSYFIKWFDEGCRWLNEGLSVFANNCLLFHGLPAFEKGLAGMHIVYQWFGFYRRSGPQSLGDSLVMVHHCWDIFRLKQLPLTLLSIIKIYPIKIDFIIHSKIINLAHKTPV